ncbi:5'a2rel-related protein [Leishmania mexicana MHOM/GT/2001/U1103]|uniref:5'a2rel-related protein n=1 Tax=Leishmania mexicana (strain MHOM/GT/2001/U1103) TaxID=929439 RepID=E9AVQ4_LEIMU|nr:5'a2rel-related protein [Leishmania mexicana MHOM/GT/2001/U1103]CBZ27037.1 5'a2rel-related protein [Leishmania mexicana MHOM/GT/2001/U1103]
MARATRAGDPRAFARTESPSPLRRAAQEALATGNAERNAATEASPNTEVSGARCGLLGTLALPSFPGDGGQEVMDNRPRSERALRLARVTNTATLSSPPALSSTSTSAVPLPGPPPLSSASCASVPVQQQRLQLPSHSPESMSSASLSRPVVWRESLSGASVTAATSSDSYDRGDAHDYHCSRRQRSDSRYRAVSDVDDGDGTTSSSPGLTETNGARPPSHAPAPLHPSSFLTQTLQHACHSSQSSSDSAKERRPGEAQQADAARQAVDSSQASSPAPSPLTSRSPSLSAPPSAQLPPRRTAEETRRDNRGKGDGSGAARRILPHGTCPAVTEVAELQLPLATPTESAVDCGGSGAAAVAGESPPPLPPALWGADDGASSPHASRCGSHRPSKSSATGAHGVARQAAASEADVASEARAGDGEARASRERKELPAAASLRDGVAAALKVDGARRGAASSTDAPRHAQPPPPQLRALDRWRSRASVVGGATAETAALSSPLPAATHSPRGSAAERVTECDDGHPPQSARGCGETANSPLKGGVNVARWVRSTVGREADLSRASLSAPPACKAAEARVCAPRTNLGSASTASASGAAGTFCDSEPPRVVAVPLATLPHRTPPREALPPAVLTEVAQSCASAALVSRRQAYQSVTAVSWTSSSRSRVRLTFITSPVQVRRARKAGDELAVGGAAHVDPRDGSSGARWREAGSAGEAFLVRSGDARRVETASVPQHAHPLRSSSSGQRALRPGLAAVLAPRAAPMCSSASSAEVDGADEDEETRIVARTWRPVTCLESVRDDARRRSTGDDCPSNWGAAGAHRWGQGPHHPRAAQRPAAIAGAPSGRHQRQPASRPRDDSHGRVLPIEASPLASSVSLAAETTTGVGASARQACSAATWRAGVASDGVGGRVLSSTTLAPGYAAVYSPRMLATRVLEARKVLLGTPGAAAPAAATSGCPPGPSGALPPHCGSRAMPAVGATVAAAASTSGGVASWSPSSLPSPPHAHIDLKERSADDVVMPATTAAAAPWSLYLSGSPDAEESTRHRTALPRQPTRGQQHLHKQPDLPADTSPYPVARRIPFGFAAGTLAGAASAQAVSPSPDGRLRNCQTRTASPAAGASAPVPGAHHHTEDGYQRSRRPPCHAPAVEQRNVTASAHSSPIVARSAAASVAAPLGRTPTTFSPTTASSSAPRASSVGTAQGRHQSIPSPEHHAVLHAAGAGSQASERARSTSRRFPTAATHADQSHDVLDVRQKRPPHILAQQELIQEEAFRRRYISMQEDHRFAVEVAELNYQRAVEYVHQISAAGVVAAPGRRSGHCAAPLTTGCDAEPLVGLQRVRRDQTAMTATLSALAEELAALSP